MTEASLQSTPLSMRSSALRNENGQYRQALDRAGRWLALRARTEHEMRARLSQGGFDNEVVDHTIRRLRELALVDDGAFARQWIEERTGRKGLAPDALRAELTKKGVETETIESALTDAGLDEAAMASEVAARLVSKLARYPLADQARRLQGQLARRGFGAEAIESAVKAVLPPEGWD